MQQETAYLQTPIGWFEIRGSALGVSRVQRLSEPPPAPLPAAPAEGPVADCRRQLEEYFAGNRTQFDVKLDFGGQPDFHRLVWTELLKIPYGATTTYSDIAHRIGHPAAVRAVGMANRSNPVAIVVPCHRVIGKAGELRGYFYGLDTKMALLRLENPGRFLEQGELF